MDTNRRSAGWIPVACAFHYRLCDIGNHWTLCHWWRPGGYLYRSHIVPRMKNEQKYFFDDTRIWNNKYKKQPQKVRKVYVNYRYMLLHDCYPILLLLHFTFYSEAYISVCFLMLYLPWYGKKIVLIPKIYYDSHYKWIMSCIMKVFRTHLQWTTHFLISTSIFKFKKSR